jgi:hypothetical protein
MPPPEPKERDPNRPKIPPPAAKPTSNLKLELCHGGYCVSRLLLGGHDANLKAKKRVSVLSGVPFKEAHEYIIKAELPRRLEHVRRMTEWRCRRCGCWGGCRCHSR